MVNSSRLCFLPTFWENTHDLSRELAHALKHEYIFSSSLSFFFLESRKPFEPYNLARPCTALEEHIVEERSPAAGVRETVIQSLQSAGSDDEESYEDLCIQHVLELLQSGWLSCFSSLFLLFFYTYPLKKWKWTRSCSYHYLEWATTPT